MYREVLWHGIIKLDVRANSDVYDQVFSGR